MSKSITYQQLLDALRVLSTDELQSNVTVFHGDEYIPVQSIEISGDDNDVLDKGHLFLSTVQAVIKPLLYQVIIALSPSPGHERKVQFSAAFPAEPNSDDIVAYASDAKLIEPDDVPNATGVQVDFTVEGGGTIYLFRPHSPAAVQWIEDHIPETAQTLGSAVAVEHRYIADIVQGAQADGLVVI